MATEQVDGGTSSLLVGPNQVHLKVVPGDLRTDPQTLKVDTGLDVTKDHTVKELLDALLTVAKAIHDGLVRAEIIEGEYFGEPGGDPTDVEELTIIAS